MKMHTNPNLFSLTPRFSGASLAGESGKPFQRFSHSDETAERVSHSLPFGFTPLKRGVNERWQSALRVSSMVGLTLLLNSSSLAAAADTVLDIGNRRQLFIDHKFIASSNNVRLVVHPPRKTGERSIDTDRPWERGGLGPYSCVMKVGDQYVMWYHAMDSKQWDSGHTNGSICYATSKDGITWTKPNLGLVAYNGSKENNIVLGHGAGGITLGQDGMMVFADPNAPPGERFRMVCRFGNDNLEGIHSVNLFSSGDGIHWKPTHSAIITYRPETRGHHLDSQNVMFWDDPKRKYVAYVRRNVKDVQPQGRAIARGESDRLGDFPMVQDMQFVLKPDAPDAAHGGMAVVDYYNSAAMRYPWADDAYFMFPQAYYHYTPALRDFGKARPINAGSLDTHFLASRDGVNWERYDRQPFIPIGMRGEPDCYSARMIYGVVPDVSGREMYFYYRASDWLHGWDRNESNKKILADAGLGATQDVTFLSRVVLRRDGFVSVNADYRGGEFTTPALKFSGKSLKLNINTTATGWARVAILGVEGEPIAGFSLDDCDIIHTANEISRVVKWKRQADVSSLAGKPVRLRISMRNTELYAFQFQ